jgi:hypothetical protein
MKVSDLARENSASLTDEFVSYENKMAYEAERERRWSEAHKNRAAGDSDLSE